MKDKGVEQDLVFSVELHLGFTPYSLSLGAVPFKKSRWELCLSLLSLSLLLSCQVKVKSTPSPRPKNGV